MDKIFFSENNRNKLLCLLKSNGFGNGLNSGEMLEIIKPRMLQVIKTAKPNSKIDDLNQQLIFSFKPQNKELRPMVVRKSEKMSQEEIERFISNRNQFDVSVGLKPVNYMRAPSMPAEQFVTKQAVEEDPLDEFFKML